MLNCEVCGSTAIQDEIVSEVFHVNRQYQLVENIPASVCTQCGEKTFSREAAENIRKLLNGPTYPDHAIKLDVFSYAMSPKPVRTSLPSVEIDRGV
jgi:YgiT-type zinc finger domain-containing protein